MFLRVLSNVFFKSKIPSSYPKIFTIINLIKKRDKKREKWRYFQRKIDITQRFDIEDTKQRSQIRVVEGKKATCGKTL